ncbi:MAG: L-threonylcarbamoyladenylate synthase [Anaerolineales bacterium]
MQTRVIRIEAHNPDTIAIQNAADVIRAGGLVAFPTETVYGLGADAFRADAVRGIFAAKGRPTSDPLIIHLQETAQLDNVAYSIPPLAHALAEAFWPGPLTLVLPRHPRVPPEVTAGRETVAVRVPAHPVAHQLLLAAAVPIAAPSANRFSRPSPTTAQHVLDDLEGLIDLVLDAGPVNIGLESTIVDVTQTPPAILRPGGLSLEALRVVAPDIVVRDRYLHTEIAAIAPGMFLKHYAPRAELRLFEGEREAVLAHMRTLSEAGVGILATDEDAEGFADVETAVERLGPEAEVEVVGRRLFAGLRALDQRGVRVILVRLPAREGLWLAIRDRLYRAAEGRVTRVTA